MFFDMLYTCCMYIYIYPIDCETSILVKNQRKQGWKMQPLAAQRALCRRQNAYTMGIHGPKIGATNLEAGLVILILWPHFWVQNLAPKILRPQHTNRSCPIWAASLLLLTLGDSSLLYYLFEAPVLVPGAHLGFQKKIFPGERPTKGRGTNCDGRETI